MEIGAGLPNKDLLTIQEIADYVQLGKGKINAERCKGNLIAVKFGPRAYRFPRAEVLRWICERWASNNTNNEEVE